LSKFTRRKEKPTPNSGNPPKIKPEEKTDALTPDKMDRTQREKDGKKKRPYPLTEEEATPTSPKSERKSKS
jgi:hypothetical protein